MLPTTWFYLSSLMIIAVFFKFNRFWSIRNLDLIGLVMTTPGLLFLAMDDNRWGYLWLFVFGLLFCVRLILDLLMVRRPLFDPNLNPSGMTFACVLLTAFMWANISINRGPNVDSIRTLRLEQILTMRDWEDENTQKPLAWRVAGFRPFLSLTDKTNQILAPDRAYLKTFQQERLLSSVARSQKIKRPGESHPDVLMRYLLGKVFGTSQKTLDDSEATDLLQSPTGQKSSSVMPASYALQSSETTASAVSTTGGIATGNIITGSIVAPDNTPVTNGPAPNAVSPVVLPLSSPLPSSSFPGDSKISMTEQSSGEKQAVKHAFLVETGMITVVMLGHIAIVLGLIFIGHCHYNNILTGFSAAMLYLLLPYTNQLTGRLDQIIPGALIVWAVAMYRRPLFSGICIGTAAALVFHPIFLVPLWCSYYWKRGIFRFLLGTVGIILAFYLLLLLSPREYGTYWQQFLNMLGVNHLVLKGPDGLWEYYLPYYRIPIIAVYLIFCFGMIFWPARKHLATLMCCSTILLIGTQLWMAHQGGLYMAWYLPILIITLFRPNLEDRVAVATVLDR